VSDRRCLRMGAGAAPVHRRRARGGRGWPGWHGGRGNHKLKAL